MKCLIFNYSKETVYIRLFMLRLVFNIVLLLLLFFLPPIFPLKAASLRKGAWLIVLNNANETQKRKQSEFRYLRHSKLVKNSIKIRFNLYLAFQSTNDIRTEDLWLLTKLDKCTTIFPSFHPFTLCRGRRFANKRFLRDEIYAVQMEQQKFLLGHAHSSGMSENNDEISSNFRFRLESERERESWRKAWTELCAAFYKEFKYSLRSDNFHIGITPNGFLRNATIVNRFGCVSSLHSVRKLNEMDMYEDAWHSPGIRLRIEWGVAIDLVDMSRVNKINAQVNTMWDQTRCARDFHVVWCYAARLAHWSH